MASEKYANAANTTLNGGINNSTTTIVVTDATGFPTSGNFHIRVGTAGNAEIMLVTSVSSNTFTVATRGTIDSSAAQSHSDLEPVANILSKDSLDKIFIDNCQYGVCGSRPSAERAGRLYIGSDSPMMYRDNGSTWDSFYKAAKVTPPITGNYTWTHGSATATNTDTTNGPSLLQLTSPGTGDKLSKMERTLGATPISIIHRISSQLYLSVSYCGVFMGDGTKLACIGLIYESGITRLWTPKFNSLTSYAGEYFRADFPINYSDFWLKMTDDGTNRLSYYSHDGVNYTLFHSIGRTDFLTATKCGVWLGTNCATGGIAAMNWISDE